MKKKLTMKRSKDITFKEGFDEYMDNCKARNLRQGTINHYNDSIKTIYKFIDGDTLIKNMNVDTVNKFIIDCKDKLDINDVTLHTYTRDLKTLMYYFMRCDYIPTFKITLTKVDRKAVETYTDLELKKLLVKPDLKKCSFTEYKSWVLINFMLSTGVRLNSFINIKIKDLDFDNEVVYVNVTKSRKALIIPLNRTIVKILREYLRIRQHESDEDYLFCSAYGKQMNKKSVSGNLQKYNNDRGITRTGIHRYRHTFAKKWILAGGSVVTLQKILGHSSLSITECYINMLVEDLKKDIDKFNILEQFKSTHIKL